MSIVMRMSGVNGESELSCFSKNSKWSKRENCQFGKSHRASPKVPFQVPYDWLNRWTTGRGVLPYTGTRAQNANALCPFRDMPGFCRPGTRCVSWVIATYSVHTEYSRTLYFFFLALLPITRKFDFDHFKNKDARLDTCKRPGEMRSFEAEPKGGSLFYDFRF
jgi:hypothetical protein